MFNKQQFPIFRADPAAPAMRICKPGLYVLPAGSTAISWSMPGQSILLRREREVYYVKNESSVILTITANDGGNIFDGANTTALQIAPGCSAMLIGDGVSYTASVSRTTVAETSVPATGATFVMVSDDRDGGYLAVPAGAIAALTVTLPSEANSRLTQRRYIASTQIVTALTVNGATTIYGALGTLAAGQGFTLTKVAANTWAVV